MTASYEPQIRGSLVSKPVESTAIWNVDTEAFEEKRAAEVEAAIKCLFRIEAEIIQARYMGMEAEDCDYLAAMNLGMSERTYRRHKAKAMNKLARILRLTAYKDPSETAVRRQRRTA